MVTRHCAYQKSKTPSVSTLLGRASEEVFVVFVSFHFHFVYGLHFVVISFLVLTFLSFVAVLHSYLFFDIIPHPFVDYRRVFIPILYFQQSPSQRDSGYFHFNISRIFLPRYLLTADLLTTVLSGCFIPTGIFYLTPLHRHFWLNLRLSRPPWEQVFLPWSLQHSILILETQTRPICLFDSQ